MSGTVVLWCVMAAVALALTAGDVVAAEVATATVAVDQFDDTSDEWERPLTPLERLAKDTIDDLTYENAKLRREIAEAQQEAAEARARPALPCEEGPPVTPLWVPWVVAGVGVGGLVAGLLTAAALAGALN